MSTKYEIFSYNEWFPATYDEFNAFTGPNRITYNADQIPVEE